MKGGTIQSLEDVGYSLDGAPSEPVDIPGYDPREVPRARVDRRTSFSWGWGLSAAGCPRPGSRGLARGGLGGRAVAHQARLLPDGWGPPLFQGKDGAQHLSETPRWRRNEANRPGRPPSRWGA